MVYSRLRVGIVLVLVMAMENGGDVKWRWMSTLHDELKEMHGC